jgi:hypothetical protein
VKRAARLSSFTTRVFLAGVWLLDVTTLSPVFKLIVYRRLRVNDNLFSAYGGCDVIIKIDAGVMCTKHILQLDIGITSSIVNEPIYLALASL